jgi:4-hydroxy-4-methyl-2-oxoglutarate aldolase
VADADGVVVVPRASAARVAAAGEVRRDKEERARERLRAGELGVEFYGLRAKLAELGVEYVDSQPAPE